VLGVGSGLVLGVGLVVEALDRVGDTPMKANRSRAVALTRTAGFTLLERRILRV
jgi:hypothetical protein